MQMNADFGWHGSPCSAPSFEAMPGLTATLTSWCSSPLAPRRSIAFLHFPNFLRNVSGAGWNSLQLRHFLRSLGRESWQKRKMSSEPREYLRHILVEASYLISQRTVVRG